MNRLPGLSVRLKLTLSYAGVILLAGALLLTIVWLFLLRYVPTDAVNTLSGFVPGRHDLVRAFTPAAAWALGLLLVIGLVAGWFLAGRMLAPLTRITEVTRLASGGSLGYRVQLPGRNDEFRELADSFDAMLARLEAHVAEQQRFAANASHELRTPLAITQTMLDVARHDPNRNIEEVLARLHAVNARAVELTEALLMLSRADQRAFVKERVDLSLLAEEASETLLPFAEQRGITVVTDGDIAVVAGSNALLLQMTTNLLHNAIVHNSPNKGTESAAGTVSVTGTESAAGTVWITTTHSASSAMLLVENTGEQLSPQLVATLTEPFQRGTERIRSDQTSADHAGVGLGLAIVKSIVTAHDGTLSISQRVGGGLRVLVQLPTVQ